MYMQAADGTWEAGVTLEGGFTKLLPTGCAVWVAETERGEYFYARYRPAEASWVRAYLNQDQIEAMIEKDIEVQILERCNGIASYAAASVLELLAPPPVELLQGGVQPVLIPPLPIAGADGRDGRRGPPGPQGDTGATGAQGPQGIQGETGSFNDEELSGTLTLTETGSIDAALGSLILPQATAPGETAEGSAVWDTNDNLLTVGTGSGQKTMVDTDSVQTLTNKTLTAPVIGTGLTASGSAANNFGGSTGAFGTSSGLNTFNGDMLIAAGKIVGFGAPQALSGAGAVNITTLVTLFTSTGPGNALTLADGTQAGQIKFLMHVVDGGSGVLTPTTKTNFTTLTVTSTYDWGAVIWDGSAWRPLAVGGTAAFA